MTLISNGSKIGHISYNKIFNILLYMTCESSYLLKYINRNGGDSKRKTLGDIGSVGILIIQLFKFLKDKLTKKQQLINKKPKFRRRKD